MAILAISCFCYCFKVGNKGLYIALFIHNKLRFVEPFYDIKWPIFWRVFRVNFHDHE